LWVVEEDEPAQTQQADEETEAEALFYEQPAQIAAAVSRVTGTPPGTTGVYFVGFAGDGEQGVFRRETLFASQVFAERFGSGDRTVLLVNNVEDRETYPLASVSGLAQTLKALASRMHPADDVLVLFLTSHGSEDGLEVENGSLPLSHLVPGARRSRRGVPGPPRSWRGARTPSTRRIRIPRCTSGPSCAASSASCA